MAGDYEFDCLDPEELEAAGQMFDDLVAGTHYEKQEFQGHPPRFLTACKSCGVRTALPEDQADCYICTKLKEKEVS